MVDLLIVHAPEGSNETLIGVWNTIVFLMIVGAVGSWIYRMVKKNNDK